MRNDTERATPMDDPPDLKQETKKQGSPVVGGVLLFILLIGTACLLGILVHVFVKAFLAGWLLVDLIPQLVGKLW